MGGSDDDGQGLPYSQRLSNLAPGQTPTWTLEPMQGQQRIEGVGILLPDGTVFLCSGAEEGTCPGCPSADFSLACMVWEQGQSMQMHNK